MRVRLFNGAMKKIALRAETEVARPAELERKTLPAVDLFAVIITLDCAKS